jgi:hypothetical protein
MKEMNGIGMLTCQITATLVSGYMANSSKDPERLPLMDLLLLATEIISKVQDLDGMTDEVLYDG